MFVTVGRLWRNLRLREANSSPSHTSCWWQRERSVPVTAPETGPLQKAPSDPDMADRLGSGKVCKKLLVGQDAKWERDWMGTEKSLWDKATRSPWIGPRGEVRGRGSGLPDSDVLKTLGIPCTLAVHQNNQWQWHPFPDINYILYIYIIYNIYK